MSAATGATYSLYLASSTGERLAVLDRWEELQYALVVNDRSSLTLTLSPGVALPPSALPDGQIEVWRRVPGGREYLVGDKVWLIQGQELTLGRDGLVRVALEAEAPLWLLGEPGRYVNAYAGTSGARKTAAADNMMKAIVRENAGASALPQRQYAGLGVQGDTGQAPSLTKAFAWKPVLQVLQEIAQSSAEAGTYLAFDIVAVSTGGLEFQTFVGARGVDRRFPGGVAPLLLGSAYGNLAEVTLRIDYRDEVTSAAAGGQGDGSGRLIEFYLDSARAAVSPYRRREVFKDATSYTTTAGLSAEAQAVVRAGRPRLILAGKIQQTRGALLGADWDWGDYVTVQEFGYQLDARIDALTARVTPRGEQIDAVVRAETYL